ncbi:unnamed protein product, partial [Prorocentrum cordatum]
MLQAEVDAAGAEAPPGLFCDRAADVLAASALDRLRPFTVPAEYTDIPPLRGAEDALNDLLGADSRLAVNFLSQTQRPSGASRAFWQAELYLRSLQPEVGAAPVEEAAEEAREKVEAEPAELQQALRGSTLLARQNYVPGPLRRRDAIWVGPKIVSGSMATDQGSRSQAVS